VKERFLMHSESVYLEIGQGSLKALRGEAELELPLERLPNGRLSEACKNKLTQNLQGFLKKDVWQPRLRAICAVGARGVSLRRLTLPSATNENLRRLLLLQIESEFPLPPEALAWGYRQLPNGGIRAGQSLLGEANSHGKQDFLVAAVKKEVIGEYWEVLSGCGVLPVFTLAGLARSSLRPLSHQPCALLDIGRHYSELMSFDNGVPTAVRILPWGGESITQAIASGLGISRDEAETLKLKWAQESLPDAELRPKVQAAVEAALDSLAGAINSHSTNQTIYLTGRSACLKDLSSQLARRLGPGVQCESLEPPPGEGCSAAILGLKTAAENGRECPPLIIQVTPANGANGLARRVPLKWATVAVLLALASLALPYGEALLLKSRLSRKLTAIQTDKTRLTTIDRELDFLRYLKESQPPYLDALFLLAKAAPQGARFDSLSMNRRGDLSLRGSMKDSQQVVGFRSKLIDSGFFANVAVEEQTPTPDRQKVTVRINAQWKPASARASLALGPTAEEIEKAKIRPKEAPSGAFPGMGPGLPGGLPMPVGPPPAGPGSRKSSSVGPKGPPPPGGMKE
jgi:Tfp pilus assembly PilM family ATPase